ncbi:hypothetical protein B0H11DRAFT_1872498 [Mycena galericulata]|nr:hypothetical protein B0H11DRAFT_1872498 [Mycena galericulata]
MAEPYSRFQVSPKKRSPPDGCDEASPKKSKYTSQNEPSVNPDSELPVHLSRLRSMHAAVQHALSYALATCTTSPTSDTGIIRNVLNNFSLSSYSGLTTQLGVDDLRRLCWIWEWDGMTVPAPNTVAYADDPFLECRPPGKDWTRGAMGIVLSPATTLLDGRRVPAYGIGIEIDLDKDAPGDMTAVAQWTTAGESRMKAVQEKLLTWVKLHLGTPVPRIPCADLPHLASTSFTRTWAPKPALSPFKLRAPPSLSGFKSVPVSLLQTPSSHSSHRATKIVPGTPQTPSTPDHATSLSTAPSSSRRQALYERLRQRSLTASPTKVASSTTSGKLTRARQDELRKRCLLGRLEGVAEVVWMYRRALPMSEVTATIIKSSPVPLSSAEAAYSLTMLTKLCPFFLKQLPIAGKAWLEMPAPFPASSQPETGAEILENLGSIESGGLREVRVIIQRELLGN